VSKGTIVLGLAVAVLVATVWVGGALSQEAQRPAGQEAFRVRFGRFDPEQMRQRMLERFKEALGATDEEWKVLRPRIEKVQTLSSELRGRGGLVLRSMRRRPSRQVQGRPEAAREPTGVEKALQELRTVLDNEEAKPQEIKKALSALRGAREKVKQQLARAQEELRGLLTVRQEAQLVLMGMLD